MGGLDNRRFVDPQPLISLQQAYESIGNTAEAERIRGVMDRVRSDGDVINEMRSVRKVLTAGRYEEALRRLKPIAEGKSWFAPLALFRMSVAEEALGNVEASRNAMRGAIALYRAHGQPATDAYFEAGTSAYLKHDFVRAAEWYRLAFRESPNDANVALHLGLALEETDRRLEATQLYERIIRGDLFILPGGKLTISDVSLQMAVAMEKLGRPREAIGYLEGVLRRFPDHPKRQAILNEIATLRSAPTP